MPPRSFRVAARIWLLIIFIKLRHLLTSFLGFWPPTTRLPTDWVLLNRKSFGWRCGGFAKTAGVRRIEFGSFVLAWFFWLLFSSWKKVTKVYPGQNDPVWAIIISNNTFFEAQLFHLHLPKTLGTIKKLASQTLTYGLSTIVGRFINFLLVPLYTAVYSPHDYGIVTDVYALVAFLNILLTYGMETSFFNYARQDEHSVGKTYATGFNNLLITTSIFLVLGSLFYKQIAIPLGYSNHPEYILWFVWILGLDALSALPFALLRQLEKPVKFSVLKLLWVLINVLLNLYFLLWAPHLAAKGIVAAFFNPEIGLGYIFISNLVASLVILILLLKRTNPI